MESNSEPLLTSRLAYLCMFEFLRRYYERGQSDEVGGLLGGLSLLADGQPADSAYALDWEQVVKAVLADEASPLGFRAADFLLGSDPK